LETSQSFQVQEKFPEGYKETIRMTETLPIPTSPTDSLPVPVDLVTAGTLPEEKDTESELQQRAKDYYVNEGPLRSLDKTAEFFGIALRTAERWSRKYKWKKAAEGYDENLYTSVLGEHYVPIKKSLVNTIDGVCAFLDDVKKKSKDYPNYFGENHKKIDGAMSILEKCGNILVKLRLSGMGQKGQTPVGIKANNSTFLIKYE